MTSAILLIDKPSGPTSHDVVRWARRILKNKSMGHTGTLDPLASGLLILLLGEATKLSQYIMDGDKEYIVEFKLGAQSNTFDREGTITPTLEKIPPLPEVQKQIHGFKGSLNLKVPSYSAVKVQGKTLMEMARKNQEVPEIRRDMIFHETEFLSHEGSIYRVRIRCGKGAYIRSWVHELGEKLGCGAYITELRRTENSGFLVSQASPIQKDSTPEDLLGKNSFPIEKGLPHWPRIQLEAHQEERVRNGAIPPTVALNAFQKILKSSGEYGFLLSSESQKVVAIVKASNPNKVILNRVFTY